MKFYTQKRSCYQVKSFSNQSELLKIIDTAL